MEVELPDRVQLQVTLDAELLRRAQARNVDVSAALENSLRHLLNESRTASWQAENQGAIEDANAYLDRHGLWSDGKRGF